MTNPTPKQLAMARRIYADYMRRTLTSRGDEYDDALICEVTDGMHDGKHGVQIALAAIIETSERAAKYADDEITRIYNRSPTGHGATTAMILRNAYRKGDHLDD